MIQEIGAGFNENGTDDEKFPLAIRSDNEIHVDFKTRLDIGVILHAHWEIEATDNDDTFDEMWLRVTGRFGRIIVGWDDLVAHEMPPDPPAVGLSIGDASDWIDDRTGSSSGGDSPFKDHDLRLEAADVEQITYLTPQGGKLRFGVSYMPDAGQEGQGGVATGDDIYQNGFALGATYQDEFGKMRVEFGAGYQTWFDQPLEGTGRPEGYSIAARFGLGRWTIGAAYLAIRDSFDGGGSEADDSQEGDGWQFGVSHAWGDTQASLTYHHGEDENQLAIAAGAINDTMVASCRYDFRPGVRLYGSAAVADYRGEVEGGSDDNRGWALVAGIRIGF
jgi:hypothetical protein